MRLKRLDITGFKSFMERSVFTFDDGITGVVGPNGCGKSNVVDAIRWAMGEQSAKNLRGSGMSDVIFNGSESKSALSMAEVALTFRLEETDSLAPQYAGFPEVTVTRRLFRNGDSEYRINNTQCRLLDVTELFLGTGVGTRAYSIIEQGRVGLIVSSKPEDRRSFIEEAAGITKYKSRRKVAERRLESTEQNLLRVADLVSELKKQTDSLQRQVKKAEKYRGLKAEIREIELRSAARRFERLTSDRKAIEERLETLGAEERESVERLGALESRVLERREALDAESTQLESLQHALHALETEVQRDSQNVAHWKVEADSVRRRLEEASLELESLESKKQALETEANAREAESEQLAALAEEDGIKVRAGETELERLQAQQSELSARLERERSALLDLTRSLAQHETKLTDLARRREELEARRTRCREEAERHRAEEAVLEGTRTEVAERVSSTRQAAQELAERKGAEELALSQTRQAFTENEIRVISAREGLGDKRTRLQLLEELQRNYEGFDRGVRAVMRRAAEADSELEGDTAAPRVQGLVADVVSTTPQYEKAIEAVLGERLQSVIVEDRTAALELIQYLKATSEGRSSFLALDRVTARSANGPSVSPDLSRPGILAAARAEVRCDERFMPVVEALLGDVVIAADLSSAKAYAESEGAGFTLVTLEGEVLRPDGVVVGGMLEGPAVGALQKKREVAELNEEVARAEALYNEAITRHYELQKQMGHSEGVLKGLAKNQHAEELSLASQEKDLHQAGEDLSRLRHRLEALTREEESFGQQLSALDLEEEGLRGEVTYAQADRDGRDEKVREATTEWEALKGKVETIRAELTALRVKVAADAQRTESIRKEVAGLREQRQEAEARVVRLQQLREEGAAEVERLVEKVREAEERVQVSTQRLAAEAETLKARRQSHGQETAQIKDEETRLRELRAHLDSLGGGLSELSLRERELSLELNHLVEAIRERHQTELSELVAAHSADVEATGDAGEGAEPEETGRLQELRASLERLGEINLTAADEYAELAQRYEFLSAQKEDLEGALQRLKSAIVQIDQTSRERFSQTFEIVNAKFQQLFPRLFGGGRAELRLTEEGPGVEAGVEIVVQPPGKKMQSVNLLSGGEKALTAVSMIFAIFLIKPTPFCLLDEVDAPLDEANVGRYNEIVKEMSARSQFILITHNKRTMEVADALYGVTMEEPGVSKLVSVRLKEAANDDAQAASA